jgi:hypothetical protein
MAVNYQGSVEGTKVQERSHSFWTDRLIHWKRPVGGREEAKNERTAAQVGVIITNVWCMRETVTIVTQDNDYHSTNVRLGAGMDFRLHHLVSQVIYSKDAGSPSANHDLSNPIWAARAAEINCLFRASPARSLANAGSFAKATLPRSEV